MSDFQEGPRTMETVLQMYPTNLQNKIILNNTKLQTIENIKNEQKNPAGKCDGKKYPAEH